MTTENHHDQTRYRPIFELVPVSLWEEDWSEVRRLVQVWQAEGVEDFELFFRTRPDAVRAALAAVRVLDVNQVTVEMFQAPDKAVLTRSLASIYGDHELMEGFREEVTAFARGDRIFEIETALRTVPGHSIHGLVRVAYPAPDDPSGRVFASIMDITQHKRAEQRFRTVARATSDLVWEYDLKTQELWWSDDDGARLSPAPYVERPGHEAWAERIHPQDRARVLQQFRHALRTGSDYRAEYRLRRKDGSHALILARGTCLHDADGQPLRMIGNMVDITEQRKLEAQLHQSRRLENLGQLTGGIAHDFNNLLTVIIGNASLLEDALQQEPDLLDLVGMTRQAASQGSELTRRLLAFARRQTLAPRATQVEQLVAELVPMLRRTLGETIELSVQQPDVLWPAQVDPAQLENALLNLCLNARDAMPAGGRLSLILSHFSLSQDEAMAAELQLDAGDYLVIDVTDTGTGMSPEVQLRAFEPFYTTRKDAGGSGLGLSMVYGFLLQSQGQVELESRPGIGTRVRLHLPRARGEADAPVSRVSTPPPGGDEHILLVEDNPLVRSYASTQLRALGYQVTATEHGAAALSALARHHYDLLFSDIVMPGPMDGTDLARHVRRARPQLPILLTSGFSGDPDAPRRAIAEGEFPFLAKPYDRSELALALRRLLDHRTG